MNQLVSIIIPTYNRALLIGETLESILNQTYTNWECIIIDDGSTDDTENLINTFTVRDSRFNYFKRPGDKLKGANSCRNYGFEISKGQYIKWFDSDDIMHPQLLEKQVFLLENNNELDFCASFSNTFNQNIENIVAYNNPEVYQNDEHTLYNYIIGKLIFLTPSPLWKRNFLEHKSLYDETLYNAHETDFNFSRLIENPRFLYSKEVLIYIRRGHQSIDCDSNTNINSLNSMVVYYQKVFLYLISPSDLLDNKERKLLLHYVFYKQLMVLYTLRKISFKVFCSKLGGVFSNFLVTDINFTSKVKILAGLILSMFLKKGFAFFDLDELKKAKNYL